MLVSIMQAIQRHMSFLAIGTIVEDASKRMNYEETNKVRKWGKSQQNSSAR